jgi:hypothetical protein
LKKLSRLGSLPSTQRFVPTVLGQGLRFSQPIRIEYVVRCPGHQRIRSSIPEGGSTGWATARICFLSSDMPCTSRPCSVQAATT